MASVNFGVTLEIFHKWVFPKIGVPQNGWFIMENPIEMHDLGVPLFSETSKLDTPKEMGSSKVGPFRTPFKLGHFDFLNIVKISRG